MQALSQVVLGTPQRRNGMGIRAGGRGRPGFRWRIPNPVPVDNATRAISGMDALSLVRIVRRLQDPQLLRRPSSPTQGLPLPGIRVLCCLKPCYVPE